MLPPLYSPDLINALLRTDFSYCPKPTECPFLYVCVCMSMCVSLCCVQPIQGLHSEAEEIKTYMPHI